MAKKAAKTETAAEKTTKKKAEASVAPAKAALSRKPYPTHDERIAMADKAIARVTALIASREALVAATEKKLADRTTALERARNDLAALQEKKTRILANKARAAVKRPVLSPEERAEHRKAALVKARAARKAAKEKRDALMEKLAQSGKSIDEALAELAKQ